MKKNVKNLIICFMMFVLCFGFVSCKSKKSLVEKVKAGETVNIAIIQYIIAPPLDLAKEGIIEALDEAGFKDDVNIKISLYNCNGDMNTVNQSVINAISRSDLIFAIATPVAQVLKNQFDKQGVNVPTFFTAVTDPVDSKIMANEKEPEGSITGTSDLNQVAKQIEMTKELNPNAKKVGFIYSSTENNSIIQLNLAENAAKEMDLEIISQSVSTSTEFKSVAESLISKGVDAIYLPTDNSLAANVQAVINVCNLYKIPTIAGESGFLDSGATICYGSVNYKTLGKMTGEMAVQLLNGEKTITQLNVQYFTSDEIIVNKTVAEEAGISIPESLLNKAKLI